MTTTPRSQRGNDPQKRLKSIPQPTEEVSLNIMRNIEGKDVERVLTAANAFVGSFDPAERYELTLIVRKMEPAIQAETP
ncbi:hypothetical protein DES34_10964 [Brevibacillus brevis]|nr:hypothetical protein DES34_10964 [Brevibacillus brevis]TQK42138.1 hypothetical protein FB479_115130 [Brevibacillus sp. AG162]GEC88612.1 hypothetical protein BBR01nite_09430 [Brevibacillus brevis]VEF86809.1 Uncharacterised protein [Brevibacillus brevis]